MVFLHPVCGFALIAVIGVRGCAGQTTSGAWKARFGPVVQNEAVVGHVVAGRTAWLTTGGDALVEIDLDSARFSRLPIHPLESGEHVSGLARAESGDLWTLVGRTVLAHVDEEDGRVIRRVPLREPQVRALGAGLPFARGAVAALDVVACGSSSGPVMPCWFPDRPALTLTDRSGASREIALEGLPVAGPEDLLASRNSPGPIRDAFVIATAVWVLGSGTLRGHARAPRPGGSVLARYDLDGRLFRRIQLPEPALVILGADAESCVLLAWDGIVVEVRS